MDSSKKLIVITGPTATGKTALGVELCLRLGGEVISADSMQVYRGLDIGTAKATPEERRGVPHHLLDVAAPGESFSVSRWTEMTSACIDDIVSRSKIPVIVGGTGLYIDALLGGADFAPAPGDTGLRERLGAEYDRLGGEELLRRLGEIDPERAARLHPADKKRIVRALEVYELSGETITEHDRRTRALPKRPAVKFALDFTERAALYSRIDRRVDRMAESGLFEEVRSLLDSGEVSGSSTSMQAIGYKEAVAYIKGEATRDETLELIKRASRRYAKRQLTWLRRDTELNWLRWDGEPDIAAGLDAILDILGKTRGGDL